MATITPPLFLTLLFFFIFSGSIILEPANGQAPTQQTWCVAKPSASDVELYNNMYYACSFVNCDVIHPQGACYEPQVLINQASVVMNSYYQKQGRNYWNCDFNKSALITIVDPSYGNCKFDSQ
ncbi:glucan endo-1,3-beta-D-glucosidase [Lactuca sativa]|uniref:glucan endo-1,3-beta-D-glucosidase n=1 Tax=Lactuca sativa TaxID=4236 RepID=UPI000CAEBE79|nr:glucan endo-1,3-beta-D-glucosidase [Lactuca sativa]